MPARPTMTGLLTMWLMSTTPTWMRLKLMLPEPPSRPSARSPQGMW